MHTTAQLLSILIEKTLKLLKKKKPKTFKNHSFGAVFLQKSVFLLRKNKKYKKN
jgi:hypothetical protein